MKNDSPSLLGLLVIAVVLVSVIGASTYTHGIMTDRWERVDSELLNKFTERVPKVPLTIGNWVGIEETISDKEFEATNCTQYVSRRYAHKETGHIVSMYLVSGTARHITIHSPDWCYQGAGFKMQSKPVQFRTDFGAGESAEFLTAAFKKADLANTGNEKSLRIFWTYSDDGNWQGPSWAKAYFAGKPAMYKIYLICDVTDEKIDAESSPALPFTREVFPEIQKALFPTATTGTPLANAR